METSHATVLVTGGASGLGAAVVRKIASCGGMAVIADLNEGEGVKLASELDGRAVFSPTDVTAPGSVEAALDLAGKQALPLRAVVNCAGILAAGKVVGKKGPHDLETFAKVIQVNLIGTFNVTRLAAARMIGNTPDEGGERGIVINTSSIAAFEGQAGQVAYAASKAGVAGMTLPLARDLAREGIRVVSIAPGIFDTAMMARPAGGSPGRPCRHRALPLPPWRSRGVRRPRGPRHLKPDAQRGNHPPRRSPPHGFPLALPLPSASNNLSSLHF